jgi:hypothetical protein
MKMESMIEKVASAIWHEGYGRHRPPGKDQWPDGVLGGSHDLFRGMAKEAIEEIIEILGDGGYDFAAAHLGKRLYAALKENEERTA